MSVVTITNAIQMGIESIELRDDLSDKERGEAVKLLTNLLKRDWYNKWDKESIIKALFDYKERNGVAPTVTNLSEFGMPKNTTIQTYFHMKASLLLRQLFPENKTKPAKKLSEFGFSEREQWISCFVQQFNKHLEEGMSSRRYDLLRDHGTPSWSTIARNCDVSTWAELMGLAGVKYPKKPVTTVKIMRISRSSSPTIEKLENIMSQRRILNDELNTILRG